MLELQATSSLPSAGMRTDQHGTAGGTGGGGGRVSVRAGSHVEEDDRQPASRRVGSLRVAACASRGAYRRGTLPSPSSHQRFSHGKCTLCASGRVKRRMSRRTQRRALKPFGLFVFF